MTNYKSLLKADLMELGRMLKEPPEDYIESDLKKIKEQTETPLKLLRVIDPYMFCKYDILIDEHYKQGLKIIEENQNNIQLLSNNALAYAEDLVSACKTIKSAQAMFVRDDMLRLLESSRSLAENCDMYLARFAQLIEEDIERSHQE